VQGVVWEPSPEYIQHANVTRFMRTHGLDTYDDLVRRSVQDIEWFWDAVVDDLGIEWPGSYERVLDVSNGPEWSTWFVGGRTNVAHQCVDVWSRRTPAAVAVVWEGEDGDTRAWTYAELRSQTDRLANLLVSLGVGQNDAVGIFLPMAPETVAAVMACSKIGAIWVPIFSGFAADAVAARLADAGVKLLITAEGSLRKGRAVPMRETAERAIELTGVGTALLVWDRLAGGRQWAEQLAEQPGRFETRILDAEHPLFIGYTSGTTGKPKGVLHVHGGFLVKIAEEVAYQVDLHPDERLHWATDLGWIMGPWEIVGALALGATVALFEGAPTHPGPDRLWSFVERHEITTLGVSPTLIRALISAGTEPVRMHDLSSLRILGSTGEPWDPESYGWLFREVGGERAPIINISGGTEVGACFLSPLPITPLKACTLRGPALGMAVDVWDRDGRSVGPGEVGELVCTRPWPSMARGVWGDPERYLDAYWRRFPGVWVHGDWASRDADGFWFLHGRSDDTLNVAGKRLGPAEVESVIAIYPGVAESAAVGVPDPVKGETIWCFVVRSAGAEVPSEELTALVAEHLGKSFAPSRIVFVNELPKTRSAKIVRRAMRAIAAGEDPGDLSSLENPDSLDAIRAAVASDA
jgi:acetyl-CoA synthetase